MRNQTNDVSDRPGLVTGQPPFAIPWARVGGGIAISIVLLWLAAREVDLPGMGQIVVGIRYPYVLLATIVYFVDLGFRALRWQVLLCPTGKIPARRLYPVLAIGYMANNLLPVRIGELSRAYLVAQREQVEIGVVLASVAIERIVDGLTVVTLLLVTLPFIPAAIGPGGDWVSALALLAGVTFGIGTLFIALLILGRRIWIDLARETLERLPPRVRLPALRAIAGFIDGLGALKDLRRLTETLVLSIAIWVIGAVTYVLVGAAFDVSLSPLSAITTICVVNLATAVPLAPAGLGAFEAVAERMLVLLGVATTTAFGMTIVLHAVLFFPVVVVGLFFLWRTGLTFGHLWRRARVRSAHPVELGP